MYFGKNFSNNLHIGSLIDTWIKDHHITKTKFAELMELPQTNAGRLLKNKGMDIGKLIKVCQVLKHNFFADICGKFQYVDNIEMPKYIYFCPPGGKYNEWQKIQFDGTIKDLFVKNRFLFHKK